MTNLVGIAGSLRSRSFNMALLRTAAQLMPAGASLEIGSIQGIPLYDADLEAAEGIPDAVSRLQDQIASSGGLVIVTPEYNNSIPGVLKNAMDWLSRPSGAIGRVFSNRPVAIMGASPGGFGTVMSQAAWLPVLRMFSVRLWSGGRMIVSGAGRVFDDNGEMVDEEVRERLRTFMEGFVAFASAD